MKKSNQCLELLLNHFCKPDHLNLRDRLGRTPLHIAAYQGGLDCTQILLKRGADLNCKDRSDLTPLMVAAMQGHNDIVGGYI
jgi:ankyrin repeat protein